MILNYFIHTMMIIMLEIFLNAPCAHGTSSKKFKRDYTTCDEKCTLRNNARREMLAFDYIPIEPQLKLIMKCKTLCHELLSLWRNSTKWLDQNAMSSSSESIDFWDGSKFQEVKDFWNPHALYELTVVCTNGACKKTYTTFLASKPSKELSWNVEQEKYTFECLECKKDIHCSRQMCKVCKFFLKTFLHLNCASICVFTYCIL